MRTQWELVDATDKILDGILDKNWNTQTMTKKNSQSPDLWIYFTGGIKVISQIFLLKLPLLFTLLKYYMTYYMAMMLGNE